MSKSPEQDRLDRQAAKNRKQRGLGGAKKTTSEVYVPLVEVIKEARFHRVKSAAQAQEHERLKQEFTNFLGLEFAKHVAAIEKSGATSLNESDKGFGRIVDMLKGRYRNSNVKWNLSATGVMFAKARKVA